jgi:hypothetical protein
LYLYGSFIQLRNFTTMANRKYPSGADATHEHYAKPYSGLHEAATRSRDARINKILDDAGAALKAEGVQYFLGVVDRQPEAEDGGKVHTQTDIESENMIFILDAALPTREDLVNMGVWVGGMLNSRK